MSWVLAILLAAQEPVVTVTVQTKDGNELVGTTDVTVLKIESSLGTVDVKLEEVSGIQTGDGVVVLSTRDGGTLRGKISVESWKIKTKIGEFNVKTSDIASIRVDVAQKWVPPRPRDPSVPQGPAPSPSPEEREPETKKPLKLIKLNAAVPRIALSGDGERLYVLDASDSKVHVVDASSFETEKTIQLPGGETSLSLAPSDAVLVAAGKKSISVASIPEGKVTKTFSIEVEMHDICALSDQNLIASSRDGLLMISISKQAVVENLRVYSSEGRLLMTPDRKKIYTRGGAILLPDKAAGRNEITSSGFARGSSEDFFISSDGRYAVARSGAVYRLGRSFVADMAGVAQVERNLTGVFLSSKKRLLLFTEEGFVKEYDTETFELAGSWFLGYRVYHVFADEAAGTLDLFAGALGERGYGREQAPAGDLFKFELPK